MQTAHIAKTALIALLRFYKVAVSPMLGDRCRFYPSCSDYAREAIQYHGAARGSFLAAKRLCRCHPFSAGGIDLVPVPPCAAGCVPQDGVPAAGPVADSAPNPAHSPDPSLSTDKVDVVSSNPNGAHNALFDRH
ncbi:membrane protein [Caballeronia sordidicola]|uniref:Putative membrane protein insertion efficiency factor n=1 Tax=Caballeronia sordidicola TaxID=196367 RepID=A0A158FCD2_CABSO|nr:membrane protein [Caballeronia sordidicola]